jgi:uncharacterized protein
MILVYLLMATYFALVFALGDYLRSFCRTTGNLLSPTLFNYVPFFVVLGALWWKVGRIGPDDLGLDRSKLPMAIRWVLCFWVAAQLGYAGIHMGDVTINPVWDWGVGATTIMGELLAQLLGNALCEELFWRGFVMTQLAALLYHRGWRPSRALMVAVLLSSVLFALSHIPRDMSLGLSPSNILGLQVARLGGGLILAGIYALSRNLLLVIGFHAVMNVPASIFAGYSTPAGQSFLVIGPLVLLVVLELRRGRSSA